MNTTDSKLEKLQRILASSPDGIQPKDIAERLGCNVRTVQRYLDTLKDEGVPVEKVEYGVYRLDPKYLSAPARFHPNEALAVYLMMRRGLLASNRVPRFFMTAIERILPALAAKDLTERLNTATDRLWERREQATADGKNDDEIWETLAQAWRERLWVRLTYQKLGQTQGDMYRFAPLLFEPVPGNDGMYVIGMSGKYAPPELRTLKIDRILQVSLTSDPYQGAMPNIDHMIERAWGIDWGSNAPPKTIRLLFDPRAAQRVLESIYHPAERKTLQDDGTLLWEAELSTDREILPWIRGWSHQVIVLEPPELRQVILNDLQSALQNYEEVR